MKKNRFLTIMVIPHTEKGPKSLKISLFYIRTLATMLIIALTFTFIWMYDYTYLSRQNASLKYSQEKDQDTIKTYSKDYLALYQDVLAMKEKMSSVEDLEQQVRQKNGFDPTISFFSKANLQALNENDDNSPKDGAVVSSLTVNQTKNDVDLLKKAIPEKEKSLNELIRLMEDRNEALLSIPSIWPTVGRITSSFGYRRDPINYRLSFHDGLDIANAYGTPVYATADGIVVYAQYNSGYGNEVKINHGNGYLTWYGHNSRIVVKKGEFVRKGQLISYMGSTGRSTGPHVHYGILKNGTPVNPMNYLN